MQNTRFYDCRKRLGLKRAELARELGMSPTTIYAYEAGKHTVPKCVWLAMKTLWLEKPETDIVTALNEQCKRFLEILGSPSP
jgi:DNA-binding XRE family transcriptional regulator